MIWKPVCITLDEQVHLFSAAKKMMWSFFCNTVASSSAGREVCMHNVSVGGDGTVPAYNYLPPSCSKVDWLSGPYGGWYGDGGGGERASHRDL